MKLNKFIFSLFALTLSFCETRSINFRYTKLPGHGIVIENYYPIEVEQLNSYLTAVNDTLKYQEIHVHLWAHNIQKLNPEFKQNFLRSSLGKMILKERSNDTANIMHNYSFGFGTFKEGIFSKDDLYDSALLKGKFLLAN